MEDDDDERYLPTFSARPQTRRPGGGAASRARTRS